MAINGSWVKWAMGVVITVLLTALPMIISNVVANDKDSRARDTRLEEKCVVRYEDVCDKMNKGYKEQSETNQQILVTLAEIKSYMKYRK